MTPCGYDRIDAMKPNIGKDANASATGRMILLPGITNTTSQLAYLQRRLRQNHQGMDIRTHRWGPRLGWIHTLRSYERNRETARAIAADLAAYRRDNQQAVINLLGYSGGGGLAVFIVQALPDDVAINRLILIAPAISYLHPIADDVLPHVSELMVNFTSWLDIQIGLGTRIFGNMDGTRHGGAGAKGFNTDDPKLLQIPWRGAMIRQWHPGNHIAYLSPPWQRKYLFPALDPARDPAELHRTLRQ
jgi:pimeloyl-ACP methyl ester carboxylesterase